jgi:hypothetical protein
MEPSLRCLEKQERQPAENLPLGLIQCADKSTKLI